jgi:hypothetical protein
MRKIENFRDFIIFHKSKEIQNSEFYPRPSYTRDFLDNSLKIMFTLIPCESHRFGTKYEERVNEEVRYTEKFILKTR